MLRSARERRDWQRGTPEVLVVAVLAGPRGPDAAEFSLRLGKSLLRPSEVRRSHRGVVLWEADFWAPTLSSHLEESETEAPDLLDHFEKLAQSYEIRSELRIRNGIPQSDAELERWRDLLRRELELRPLLVASEKQGGKLHAFPARTSNEAFDRLLDRSQEDLVKYMAPESMLPGVAVVRGLIAATSRELSAGIALISLPAQWSPWTLLLLGQVADVLIILTTGERGDDPFLKALAAYVSKSRHALPTRPSFEEEILFSKKGNVPPYLKEIGREIVSPRVLGPAKKQARSDLRGRIDSLALDLDLDAASKAAGVPQRAFFRDFEPDDDLARELRNWQKEERVIRVLVEKGDYGESPIRKLGDATQQKVEAPGFALDPRPITHQEWFERTVAETAEKSGLPVFDTAKQYDETIERFLAEPPVLESEKERGLEKAAPIDLIAFPYYMLGALAEQGLLLPLHLLTDLLDDVPTKINLDEFELEQGFHNVNEMCQYHGVLYAVPYIFTQRILLVKKEHERVPALWPALKQELLRWKEDHSEWPLLLETDPKHVGAWYDWLEMVFAHGSNDFFRAGERLGTSFRGSDYGECQLTAAETVKATQFYLDLLQATRTEFGGRKIDWDEVLAFFMKGEEGKRFWATLVWSDAAAFHWRGNAEHSLGLEGKVRAYPFPLADSRGRLSVEGWVLGAPTYLNEKRRRLAAQFLAWFLDPTIQLRFAEGGGSTARRDVGHALGEIQRLVHRTVSAAATKPALKITFWEAPVVIEILRRAIAEKWIIEYPKLDREKGLTYLKNQLDEVAKEIVETILKAKSRWRSREYWQDQRKERSER